ncbi:MAG: sugar phosphate nucleotidyltransferase [Syntrophorhabdaceae bacterium]|nr:sugar phosphate nucleotidyltransferase [Syntrophorhabdaceae bacterium]
MAQVLAMILAGGRVGELDVLTFFRPKSVLPYGGLYRVIDFPMSNLMHSDIENVGILSQYRPFELISHIANGEPWDMTGRQRRAVILPPFQGRGASDWYKGTADAVYQNIDFMRMGDPQIVVVLSGDHIYRMDYRKLIEFHIEKNADMTVAFTKVSPEASSRFGLASIEDEDPRGGRVTQYREKPKNSRLEWASLTIYVFRAELLIAALQENAASSSHEFGKDIIPMLMQKHRVYGYKHSGYWGYTRTMDEYYRTSMDVLGDTPRIDIRSWQLRTNMADSCIRDRQPAFVGPAAAIKDAFFHCGCSIKGRVEHSILFPGVTVEEGAVVKDSILFFDSAVRRGAQLRHSIVDTGCVISERADIGDPGEDLTVVGMKTVIPEGIRIRGGVRVHPKLTPDSFSKNEYVNGEVVQ